ncbi:class I SAM-dependent methyltransferase [Gordonia sp. DT219]|uniref:class I SAM-dependent methyltransferase n=1 Tax=Gordonia sp. DT219 TaxID=3416658 RepID=UPI003CE819D3
MTTDTDLAMLAGPAGSVVTGELGVFDHALSGARCLLRAVDGRRTHLPVSRWHGTSDDAADAAFDAAVVRHCHGPTVDLGCGPGRLVDALTTRGVTALGVDESHTAVATARIRGIPVLQRDILGRLPCEGRWAHALLIDGNIGIGGDPDRLLGRVGALLGPGGSLLAEIDPHISGHTVEVVRIESETHTGPWFQWAQVGIAGLRELLPRHGFDVAVTTEIGDRLLVEVVRR